MIKVLHTADWHIGKMLHKHPLDLEMATFFNWLIDTIKSENIDVLLVSGDIFDVANPSAKDRDVYYNFLKDLIDTKVRVVITGGNHDSIAVLNAPNAILNLLDIHVVGGATTNLADELILLDSKNGDAQILVGAVPFLRPKDFKNQNPQHNYNNRVESIKEGIKNHYNDLVELYNQNYAGIPFIAMGHLYARGVDVSESEREIHVGNQAAIQSDIFRKEIDYVALGHIHKPQVIGSDKTIRYSGSPIPLSFSEKRDEKSVVIINFEQKEIPEIKILKTPKSRVLKKIEGSLAEVRAKLENFKHEGSLAAFVEIAVKEETYSTTLLTSVDDLIAAYETQEEFKILKSRVEFKSGQQDTSDLFKEGIHIEELTPQEVFSKRIESESLAAEDKALIADAFQELLEQVQLSED